MKMKVYIELIDKGTFNKVLIDLIFLTDHASHGTCIRSSE
jgi:hypothetical protein